MRKTSGSLTVVVVVAVAALLVACSSSSKTATTAKGKSQSSTSSARSGAPALVTVKKDAKLGEVLADSHGLTLYTLTADNKPVACSGACAQAWPPLELPAGVAGPSSSPEVKGLTAVKGPYGQLVALGGLPLYRFVKDKDSGDAYGEGIQSFGGVWHVAKAAGSPATPTTVTTTAKSGY